MAEIDPAEIAQSSAQVEANAAPPIPQGGLEVVSIAKSYDKRAVLTDISLSVGKGEVLGLLGPNGAGKTTCFYSIMGLVRPDGRPDSGRPGGRGSESRSAQTLRSLPHTGSGNT